MPSKDYEDPVQIQVRKLLNRAMIQTFGLFEYQFDELVNKFMPVLPLAHDDCIDKVIQIVKGGQSVCVYEMKMEIAELQKTHPELVKSKKDIADRFTDTCARISSGYIARLLLDTICTFQVCKNWNSHGAILGATMCQIASMLSGLDAASKGLIDVDFNELIPKGNVMTGHRHGHHEMSYVEYMTSGKERSVVTGTEELYLDHLKFRSEHHDAKIRQIMDRELENIKAPAPRPMRAHTFDFNLSFHGARLLDGECKGSQAEHEKAILVFHSLDQLAFKDEALALLTTNNSFTFYSSYIVDGAGYIQTTYHELRKFKLGPVSKLDVDPGAEQEHLQAPPSFAVNGNAFTETDATVLEVWKNLRSEIREFMTTILDAIDILCNSVSAMKVDTVCKKCRAAYKSGWKEPYFTAAKVSDLKSRRPITNQEEFIYCRKTIEGEDPAEYAARYNRMVHEGFKQFLESDNPLVTAEMHAAAKFSYEHTKAPDEDE